MALTYDWIDFSYSFLPGLNAAKVPANYYGINDYAFTVYLENEGDAGSFSLTEPFISSNNPQIKWNPSDLAFHYPAETKHMYNGTEEVTYDLEMLIMSDLDPDSTTLSCSSKRSGFSIFFQQGHKGIVNETFLDFMLDVNA